MYKHGDVRTSQYGFHNSRPELLPGQCYQTILFAVAMLRRMVSNSNQ
jgi:hypothetical protein